MDFRLRGAHRSRGSGPNLPLRGKFDPSGGLRGVKIRNVVRILGVPLTPNSAKNENLIVAFRTGGTDPNPYPVPPIRPPPMFIISGYKNLGLSAPPL